MANISVDWETIIGLVETNQTDATDVAKLVVAAIAIAAEVKTNGISAAEIIPTLEKVAPDVIPILEAIANILFPGSGTLIEVVGILAQLLFFTVTLSPTQKNSLTNLLVQHTSVATGQTEQEVEDGWFQRQNSWT
jgi:hypothetical protein